MHELGYQELLPVQEEVFPHVMNHQNTALQSATGTGKTFSYLLPAATLKEKTLIIAPTRELAVQIRDDLSRLTVYEKIRSALLIGGADISVQLNQLKQDPLFIIATPGRLCDCLDQGAVSLDDISLFVLDEADQIISTGQYDSLKQVIEQLPDNVTYVCVSATWNERLNDLFPKDMITVRMDDPEKVSSRIDSYCYIDENKKQALLHILNSPGIRQIIIFVNYKSDAEKLAEFLNGKNILASPFSSRYDEKQRLQTLRAFKEGSLRVLTATDAAARGLDLPVSHIIHYDLPADTETFIHRSGRTAHQGNTGISIVLMTPDEAAGEQGKQIAEELTPFIPEEGSSDLSEPVKNTSGNTNTRKYLMRAGKKDKLRKGDIIGALCTVIPFEEIGTVDLQDRYTVITVLNTDDHLSSKLDHLSVKGKKRRIEVLKNEDGLSFMKGR